MMIAERGEVALRGFEDPVRLYEARPGDRVANARNRRIGVGLTITSGRSF